MNGAGMNLTVGILLVVAGGALEGCFPYRSRAHPVASGKTSGGWVAGGADAGALAGGFADRAEPGQRSSAA